MTSLLPLAWLLLTACGGGEPTPPAAAPVPAPAQAAAPAAPTPTAAAPDAAHGAEIVRTKCTSCHGEDVFTRPDRKVTTPEALVAQVETCGGAAHLDAAEKADVTAYLRGPYGFGAN